MGAGHSHPAHPNHRLRREKCSTRAMCGLCHRRIDLDEMAYRCTAAECSSFYLDDVCFRYTDKLKKHFSGHRLALTASADGGVAAGSSCDVCATTLDGFFHVYVCRRSKKHLGCAAAGFRAHPRCAHLPQHIAEPTHQHQLVLGAAPPADGRHRNCLNCDRHCSSRSGGRRAWSYWCSACPGVELCLPCAMGRDDDDTTCCCSCNPCLRGGSGAGAAFTCAGFAVGKILKGLVLGCIG
uniref:DC1 domain-containing protein n=1 Tax=Oryza punctata TaxID=4537 RepID=A0A0E0LXD6_ORYPU